MQLTLYGDAYATQYLTGGAIVGSVCELGVDEQTYRIVIGCLIAGFIAVLIDASSDTFEVGYGFWGLLSGILTLLGIYARRRARDEDDQ